MKKIAWLPESLNNNRFLFEFKKAFSLAGAENVTTKELYRHPRKVDYLVLNFYEDIQKKIGFHIVAYVGKLIRLYFFKLCGIKIIWILNNKIPHDDNSKWAKKMMAKLIRASYKIIVLCTESYEVLEKIEKRESIWKNKTICIPHPNYIDAYKDIPVVKNSKDDNFNILFFGSVRPYKNVDKIIKAFNQINNDKMSLTILGECKNPDYKRYIEEQAAGHPIRLDLNYISDDKIMQFIYDSTILIFCFDNETTLNSGSVIHACTAAKTFISPCIGTLKDFPDKSQFYSYSYANDSEQELMLVKAIQKAFDDFNSSPKILEDKGRKLYEYVEKEHSVEKISVILKNELNLSDGVSSLSVFPKLSKNRIKEILGEPDKIKKVHEKIKNMPYQHRCRNLLERVKKAPFAYGLCSENREKKVIVSLTSFHPRFPSIPLCLKSLILQNFKPDKIIVWLDCDEKDLTPDMRYFEQFGVEFVCGVEDLKPHKKYYFAMQKYPDDIIITVDDDVVYSPDMIQSLLEMHKKHPDCVCARRVHKITFTEDGTIKSYSQWHDKYQKELEPSFLLIPTGVGGVLYPPHSLDKRVFDMEKLKES